MFTTDGQCLSLGVHSETVVNVVDAIFQPDAAVAAHGSNRLDGFFCTLGFDAVVGYLPAALVGYDFAILQSQAIVVGEFADSSYINHFYVPLSFFVTTLYHEFRDLSIVNLHKDFAFSFVVFVHFAETCGRATLGGVHGRTSVR
jgi:hypothetical protein